MKTIKHIIIISLFITLISSCENNNEIDKEKPVIDFNVRDAFPINCDTIYFGETFQFKVIFSDNIELGSFSIDIHNNFDHHSHSTEVTVCDMDSVKEPENPYSLIQDLEIPEGQMIYTANIPGIIPESNDNGTFDEGDYHFFISLTDRAGWSVQKGLNIKMLYR